MAYCGSEVAGRWVGLPVCVLLKDGSLYVGIIKDVTKEQLTLSKAGKYARKYRSKGRSKKGKARISGLLGNMFGSGNNGSTPFGMGGGLFGMVGKAWPLVKMGFGMVRMIWPLFGAFSK